MDGNQSLSTIGDRYTVVCKIENSQHSKVKLVQDIESKEYLAAKILKLKENRQVNFQNLTNEWNTVYNGQTDDRVLQLTDSNPESIYHSKQKPDDYRVACILMKPAYMMSLSVRINPEKPKDFSQEFARFYFKQMIECLKDAHALNIAHMDLKLENLLLDESYNLKISDFGFSRFHCENNEAYHSFKLGSIKPYLCAPECEDDSLYYDYDNVDLRKAVDVFDSAIILIHLIAKRSINKKYFHNLIKTGKLKETLGKYLKLDFNIEQENEFYDLIFQMTRLDSSDRIKIDQVLNHKWMTSTKIATHEEIVENFEATRNEFETQYKLAKEAEKSKKEEHKNLMTSPIKVRSGEASEFDPSNYNEMIKARGPVKFYTNELGFKGYKKIYTVSPKTLFCSIYHILEVSTHFNPKEKLSKGKWKIKGENATSDGEFSIEIEVFCIKEEVSSCVVFRKMRVKREI